MDDRTIAIHKFIIGAHSEKRKILQENAIYLNDDFFKDVLKRGFDLYRHIPEHYRTTSLKLWLVRVGGFSFLPEREKTYELALEAVRKSSFALNHVPKEFMDTDLCLEAVKIHGKYAMQFLPVDMVIKALEVYRQEHPASLPKLIPSGSIEELERVLTEEHTDPNILYLDRDPKKQDTPLQYAFKTIENRGRLKQVVQLLLEFGAEPDYYQKAYNAVSPLDSALRTGDSELISMIREASDSPVSKEENSREVSMKIDQRLFDAIQVEFSEPKRTGNRDAPFEMAYSVKISYNGEEIDGTFTVNLDSALSSKIKNDPHFLKNMYLDSIANECASVINTSDLDEWADEYGYDLECPDVIQKANTLYKKCVDQHDKWKSLMGDNFEHFVFPKDYGPYFDEEEEASSPVP